MAFLIFVWPILIHVQDQLTNHDLQIQCRDTDKDILHSDLSKAGRQRILVDDMHLHRSPWSCTHPNQCFFETFQADRRRIYCHQHSCLIRTRVVRRWHTLLSHPSWHIRWHSWWWKRCLVGIPRTCCRRTQGFRLGVSIALVRRP